MCGRVSTVALAMIVFSLAGLPALQGGKSGQVRKEAAIAIDCECRGQARHCFFRALLRYGACRYSRSFFVVFSNVLPENPDSERVSNALFWGIRNLMGNGKCRRCFHVHLRLPPFIPSPSALIIFGSGWIRAA